MSDWGKKCLGDLLDRPLAYGVLKPGPYEEGGIPLIRIQDHKGGVIAESSLHRIPNSLHQEFKRTELREGDIIISVVGTIGRTAIVPKRLDGANVSRAFAVIGCSSEVDTHYLDQYLKSDIAQAWFKEQCQGNAQQVLNLGTLREHEIPLPSLPEQKKIAEILSGIDQLIKCTKEKNAKLKVARDALIQNLREEDKQEWVSLSEISDFVTSGSRGWSQYYSDKGARFVRIGNLSRHSIDLDPDPQRWQLVEPPKGAEGERTKLQEQDILISITADLGICCIYSSSLGDAYINQHIALVRIDAKHRSYARQVAYYICSDHCQEQIRSMNDSGAKAGLNLDSIRKVQVPLIEGRDNKIVQSIDSLQDAIMRNACQLQQLTKAKNALSSDLLSGRKRVSV
jgi:type I restriction enzyme S subunit